MIVNNWQTTHLPLLVYVVIERPLFWKSEEKREEKKNLPLSLCYFDVRTSWHSPTCYLSDILVLAFKCDAKYSSKRNEFAYDPWVWEHKNFHGKSVFYNANEARIQDYVGHAVVWGQFYKKLSFWMQWHGKVSPEGLNFPMIVCLSINAR